MFLLLCAALIYSYGLDARETGRGKAAPYRFEMRFGAAGYPIMDALDFGGGWGYADRTGHTSIRNFPDMTYRDYSGPMRMLGLASAEFSYNFHRRFTFAVGGYLLGVWTNDYDYQGNRIGTAGGASLSIVPAIRIRYIAKQSFSMYGSVGLGLRMSYLDEFKVLPTVQVVPLGFAWGRRLYGFMEMGYGTLFLGGNAGIGFRF